MAPIYSRSGGCAANKGFDVVIARLLTYRLAILRNSGVAEGCQLSEVHSSPGLSCGTAAKAARPQTADTSIEHRDPDMALNKCFKVFSPSPEKEDGENSLWVVQEDGKWAHSLHLAHRPSTKGAASQRNRQAETAATTLNFV